jgi:hypothetical protein
VVVIAVLLLLTFFVLVVLPVSSVTVVEPSLSVEVTTPAASVAEFSTDASDLLFVIVVELRDVPAEALRTTSVIPESVNTVVLESEPVTFVKFDFVDVLSPDADVSTTKLLTSLLVRLRPAALIAVVDVIVVNLGSVDEIFSVMVLVLSVVLSLSAVAVVTVVTVNPNSDFELVCSVELSAFLVTVIITKSDAPLVTVVAFLLVVVAVVASVIVVVTLDPSALVTIEVSVTELVSVEIPEASTFVVVTTVDDEPTVRIVISVFVVFKVLSFPLGASTSIVLLRVIAAFPKPDFVELEVTDAPVF